MAVVTAHLRRSAIPVFPYLDDRLLKVGLPKAVVTHLQTTADLLCSLGFTISMPNSHRTYTQTLPFIGAILTRCVQDIQAMIPMFKPQSCISVNLTLRLLGLIASCS